MLEKKGKKHQKTNGSTHNKVNSSRELTADTLPAFHKPNKSLTSDSNNKSKVDQSRQLAAIMFTDIVGYTSMMQQNEQDALMRIEHHRGVLEENIQKYEGRLLQYYGDGALIIFSSAYNAIFCAVEIQKTLAVEPKVPLRIGLHLGEIIIKGSSTYGDGVNITSRIQSIGTAGSILISDSLYQQIRNQPDLLTTSLGKYSFKNVGLPIDIHCIANEGVHVPTRNELKSKLRIQEGKGSPASIIQKYQWLILAILIAVLSPTLFFLNQYYQNDNPEVLENSIAVLPFANLNNDPEQDYFSDGITEDILNQLSKISEFNVKSRTSTLQYKNNATSIPEIGQELGVKTILEGSVRKEGNQLRIVAQLIDASSDTHIWSETYDREIDELFKLQSEIAIEIASVLQVKISEYEAQNINRLSGVDVSAYDYALKARKIWRNWNNEQDLENILQLLEQAIALDPNFAMAYALIGEVLYEGMRNYGVPPQIWVNQAQHMADIAINLDSTLADAYLLRANILKNQYNDNESANKSLWKAYELDPSNPKVLRELGINLMQEGDFRRGVNMTIKSIDVGYTKKDPEYYTSWGFIYMILGEDKTAEDILIQGKNLAPEWVDPYYELGRLYLNGERYDEAKEMLEKGLTLSPGNLAIIDALGWAGLLNNDLELAELYWAMYEDIEANYVDQTQYVPFRHRLGYLKWLEGDKDTATELFEEQLRLDLETQKGIRGFGAWYKGSYYYDLGAINAFLGNKDEAYLWLDSAAQNGFFNAWYIDVDPLLDPIRKDEKFSTLLKEEKRKREVIVDAMKKTVRRLNKKPV